VDEVVLLVLLVEDLAQSAILKRRVIMKVCDLLRGYHVPKT
jgi:hypothetical protein